MKFKRNILGLVVLAGSLALSGTAMSGADGVSAPDAINGIPAAAVTAAALNGGTGVVAGENTYINVANALTNVANALGATTTDIADLAVANKLVSDSNAAIAAAQALTAGQLIGGQTAAQIIATERGNLGVNLTTGVYTAGTAGTIKDAATEAAAGVITQNAYVAAQGALAKLTAGGISNSISLGLQAAALETSTGASNGVITGNGLGVALTSQTTGMKVQYATTALGTANTATAAAPNSTGLRLTADLAVKDVVDAAALITGGNGATVYTGATSYQAVAQVGVDRAEGFTIAATAANVVDVRDGTKQILWTMGTAANAAANTGTIGELITAINANNMRFTASAGTTAATDIVLTHTNTNLGTTFAAAFVGEGATAAAAYAAPVSGANGDAVALQLYKAQKLTTYDVNLAEVTLISTNAAAAVTAAVADLANKTAAWNAGETLEASYATDEALNLTAAGASIATINGTLNEDLAVKNAATAVLEATAVASEAITAADVVDVSTTAAALAVATADVATAAATRDAALAAFTATPDGANSTAYTASLTAYNTAVSAQTAAATAATAATNVLYGTGNTAATVVPGGTIATSTADRKAVVTSQALATAASNFMTMQVQLADTANPAGALQASLMVTSGQAGDDDGAAIVTAVNANYQATQTFSTDIATNTAGIATNVTNIATNTAGVATNVTNIATNVTNIATNTAGIATNAAAIDTFGSGIAANTTGLARVQMQMAENNDMLKSGIASALAIAGMPTAPGEGLGFSVGTGYFDGESAIAMGLTFVEGSRSYKFSLGNSGGETSASAGAAFKF